MASTTKKRALRRTAPFKTLEELGKTLIHYSGSGGISYDPKDPLDYAGHYYLKGERPSPEAEVKADREIGSLYDASVANYGKPNTYWTLKDKARLWRAVITMARLLEFDPRWWASFGPRPGGSPRYYPAGRQKGVVRRDAPKYRNYEYVVYKSTRHEGKGHEIPGGYNSLPAAKAYAKATFGPGAGIYGVSRGAWEGWINHNGRYVSFRRRG